MTSRTTLELRRSVYRAAFWGSTTFALVMAMLPKPPPVPGSPSDKVLHIIAFAVLAGLASLAYRSTSWLRLLFALSAFGALIEALQAIPQLHRDSDAIDWVADTIAAAVILAAIEWKQGSRT